MKRLHPFAGALVAGSLALAAALAACDGPQRMLDTRGPGAEQIEALWWLILTMAIVTSVVIPALLLLAIRQSRRRESGRAAAEINGRRLVWIGAVIVPLLMLFTALVASYRLSSEVYPPRDAPGDALTIEIIGHQFWWEIRYPEHGIVTANEFHIPAGRPVRLQLRSGDVIHSFWVPQLQGKMDLIPGRTHEWWIRADSAGVFRGQCAEYCGMSHALMALWVTALEPADFDDWLGRRVERVIDPETEPDSLARRGRRVFTDAGCDQCHYTPDAPLPPRLAGIAPDLSDFGQRGTIGAGRMPNTPANLASWITNPERHKPGNRMPATELPAVEMDALIAYLYTLR